MIHAVGPKANENINRQDNLDLVQITVLCSFEYAEHVLNSASIAVPFREFLEYQKLTCHRHYIRLF